MQHGRASHASPRTRHAGGRTAETRATAGPAPERRPPAANDPAAARPTAEHRTPAANDPAAARPTAERRTPAANDPAATGPAPERRTSAASDPAAGDAAAHRRSGAAGRRAGGHRRPERQSRPRPPRDHPAALTGGGAFALPRAVLLPVTPQGAAQFLTKGLATLIVLGVTGLIAFFIVADERRGVPAAEASTTRATARDVGGPGSRATDPAPLTLGEVFPDPAAVHPPGGAPAYPVEVTHVDRDCRTAAYGTLGGLLAEQDCSQVVRASLRTPYGDYRVTTGLFNLADAGGAATLDGRLRHLIETGDGSFAAMAAGEPGPRSPSQVGWHSRGHYLLYCVITRPGGAVIPNDDPNPARITADLVDSYLATKIAGRRGQTS